MADLVKARGAIKLALFLVCLLRLAYPTFRIDHPDYQAALRVKDPCCLAEGLNRILEKAKDGDQQDKIEGPVGKWKGFCLALYYFYSSIPGGPPRGSMPLC